MTNNAVNKPVTVRGMIRNYKKELVPMEDDMQYASEFHIQHGEDVFRETSIENAVDKVEELFRTTGGMNQVETEEDLVRALKSFFDKSVPGVFVQSLQTNLSRSLSAA